MDALVLALLMFFGQTPTQSTTSSTTTQTTTTSPGVSGLQGLPDSQSASNQGDNPGEIRGHVTINNKPAAGVLVTLSAPATGYSRSTTTNLKGDYVFEHVGVTEWVAEAVIGDKKEQKKIKVEGATTLSLDFSLM